MWKQALAVLLAVVLGTGVAWFAVQWRTAPDSLSTTSDQPLPIGGDFTLQSVKGPVHLADFRGKVVVLYFGYTACPDICPTSMATLKGAFGQLTPAELQQVQGIFVSVDPERDSLEHIQQYASYFHPAIMGLSGTLPELEKVAKDYAAFFRKVEMPGSAMAYTIDHSAILYVIDKDGKVRELVQHAVPPAELAAAIRRLL
jgi:protein SCO1/2